MKKFLCFSLLLFLAAHSFAEAGQFRIVHPGGPGGRPSSSKHRDSFLEITNEDDRGYAIDTDYRRNRLTFEHRARGDIYIPANSRITIAFGDDADWIIIGDNESLQINMRDGRTTKLRLETRANRHQVGLFATVDDGRRRVTKQLFRYADRPHRSTPPAVVVQRPAPAVVVVKQPAPPPVVVHRPAPAPVVVHRPAPPPPPPTRSEQIGAAIGGIVGSFVEDGQRGKR
ncbi:MAG: hypothetical protein FWG74_06100 [Planctomycetes bacterium]|nr:hypothetical protein [Planctomycetota bacterium]